jgi:hypothetical protein
MRVRVLRPILSKKMSIGIGRNLKHELSNRKSKMKSLFSAEYLGIYESYNNWSYSGIGRELAKQMSKEGYIVGITGRRFNLLESLEEEMPGKCFKSQMDLTRISESVAAFERLLKKMDGVDLIVINSGTGSINPEFPLSDELETVAVNVTGFTTMANAAYHYFAEGVQNSVSAIKKH